MTDDEDIGDADWLSVATTVEASNPSRILTVTIVEPETVNAISTTDLVYKLKAAKYTHTFIQYPTSSKYAALSAFGHTFMVNFNGSDTAVALKFKQEPGVTYETLITNRTAMLDVKNCNVFVYYQDDTAIL